MGSVISLSISMLITVATNGQTRSAKTDEQTLIQIEHLLNEADSNHDAEQASKYLDHDYIVKSFRDGNLYDKPSTLDSIRREAKSNKSDPEPKMDELRVEVVSNERARVSFKYIAVLGNNEILSCQLVDTFFKRADGWKLRRRTGSCKRR